MTKAPHRTPKVIISCAITGSIHTPTMSDALPVTPDEIAQSAIEAAEAGAAILHAAVAGWVGVLVGDEGRAASFAAAVAIALAARMFRWE